MTHTKRPEITWKSKYPTLVWARFNPEPDPELKVKLGKWYLASDGTAWKCVRVCLDKSRQLVGQYTRYFGLSIEVCKFMDFYLAENSSDFGIGLRLLRELPIGTTRAALVKAMVNSSEWRDRIQKIYKKDSEGLWAPCVKDSKGTTIRPNILWGDGDERDN